MSDHHHCSPDCECRISASAVVLDTAGAVALARERGVVLPVSVKVISRYGWSWRPPFRRHTSRMDRGDQGIAWHEADYYWQPCELHAITIIQDNIDVQRLLCILLHEIEHCIQAESFDRMVDWSDEYLDNTEAYEAAAIAAESEWSDYGYLIERKT